MSANIGTSDALSQEVFINSTEVLLDTV